MELRDENGEIVDCLGLKNLSIVKRDGANHLMFIDPHNICSTNSKEENRLRDLKKAIDYLIEVKEAIS